MQLKTDLLPHQAAAVEKLRHLKVGALFMEMGTGKTRTTLELVKLRLDAGKVDAALWLCPCSMKGSLLADIEKHSDFSGNPALTICGIETLSSSVRAYSGLLSLVQEKRVFLIVDESSLVKNHSAIRSRHITAIAGKCAYKLILNGTPVTKYEADLFSQFYLLDWRILGYRSFYSFAANHLEYDKDRPGKIVRALNVDYLTRKIEPYTYQCQKDDVFRLPSKNTTSVYFCMSSEQDAEYEKAMSALLTDLDEMSDSAIYQLFGALQSITSGFRIEIKEDKRHRRHVKRRPMFANVLENPRIGELKKVITEIPQNEKAIIFCTYSKEIEDITSILGDQAIPFYGGIPQKERQARIEQFRDEKRFLVANKTCGAFGLNLQFCHRIIFYSNDWNWGTRAQAEDRVHRYGQTQDVEIINIYASDSIDVQILRCLDRKERLADKFRNTIDEQSRINFLRGGKAGGKNLSSAKCIRGNAKAP